MAKKPKTLKAKSARGRKSLDTRAQRANEKILEEADSAFMFEEGQQAKLWKQAPWKKKFNARMVEGPVELWEVACRYFEWVADTPLYELKAMNIDKSVEKVALPKMRAMTIEGLCLFMGISRDTWNMWGREKEHPDLSDVVSHVNMIIREQKFTGAASDLLNASIITRDLGLTDKQEIGGLPGKPLEVSVGEILANRMDRLRKAKETQKKSAKPKPTKKKPIAVKK